jgi:hypothetical protein
MPLRLRHPHMNIRVLTVFALVSLPILAVGAAIVLGVGQSQLRGAFGLQLSQVAEHTASAVDAYVFRRVIDVSEMARVPTLRQAAEAASARPFDSSQVMALDRQWQSAGAPPDVLKAVTSGDAALFLRDIVQHDPIYREILLTDRQGRLVAASNPTSDYFQADEDWWHDAYADGLTGRASLTDVSWDDSARVFAMEIAVPVPGTGSSDLAGVLKVVADIREMLAFVAGTRVGLTGQAVLLRPDGSVVFSSQTVDPTAIFYAAPLLREHLQSIQQVEPPYHLSFTAVDHEGARNLIGVAPSQLGLSYPKLSWLVAVSQSEDELFAPVRTQLNALMLVIALTAVAVLLLALVFSMRLAAPPVDIDMHLVDHPKVTRIADEEEASVRS